MLGGVGLRRRWRPFVTAALALYVVFLAVSPFEHHDLRCEMRTPLHCMACAGSALGADVSSTAAPGVCHLHDVGRAVEHLIFPHGFLLDVRSKGRSPPSHS